MVTPTVFAATIEKPICSSRASTAEGGFVVDHVETNSSDVIKECNINPKDDAIAFARFAS